MNQYRKDSESENLKQSWIQNERNLLRKQILKRKMSLIELEKKSGVPYVKFLPILSFNNKIVRFI